MQFKIIKLLPALLAATTLQAATQVHITKTQSRNDKSGGIKILYTGWGAPQLDALKKNVDAYEKLAPFDGLLIHMGVSDLMNPRAELKYDGYIKSMVKKYKSIRFKKYKHNFVATLIDQNTVEWLNDDAWEVIANNWGVAARVAREGGFDGIHFDPEGYGTYPVNNYWTSAYFLKIDKRHTQADYMQAARKRGQQIGKAIFKEYPECRIFGYYLWSFGGDLMAEMCNGILDVMPKGAALIDGDEWRGYCGKNEDAYKSMKKNVLNGYGMLDKKHKDMYKRQGQLAPAFYLDAYAYPKDNGCLDPVIYKNDPKDLFKKNLKAAKKASGGYIWIYGEKGTWWKEITPDAKYEDWRKILPGFYEVLFKDK